MDLHPTPFPAVKSKIMNPKLTKRNEVQKIDPKGRSLFPRDKPVFGTVRNPNIPLKTEYEKLVKGKPASRMLEKAKKPSQAIRSTSNIRAPMVEAKKLLEKTLSRPKKKSVSFQENEVKRDGKCLDDVIVDVSEPHTPVNAAIAKPKVTTPYHSAEKCSKCRFDKLETASHWLSQIRLAESVGKHSVSAAFFGLALDCNAEPIRNLRVELKKYLGRHDHLNEGVEWRKVRVSYGLVKEKGCLNEEEASARVVSHKDEDLVNQIAEESRS